MSYDEATRTLFVTFIDGDLYAYFDVPGSLYEAFRRSGSKGRFFAYKVRGRFQYRKIDEGPDDEAAPSPAQPPGGPASPPPAAATR